MSKYVYSDDMGEISGFGGGYEKACRDMVITGLEWLDAHPQADPHFHGYKNIYGVLLDDNQDGKDLSAAMVKVTDGDCTGAMHQASVSHVLWIKAHSWEEYVRLRREHFAKENGNGTHLREK